MGSYCLFIFLLSRGKGEEFSAFLQHQEIPGATLFPGRELSPWQKNLPNALEEKDMIFVIAEKDQGEKLAEKVGETAKKMDFERPSLYALSLESVISKRQGPRQKQEKETMGQYGIITIVKEDHAHFVLDAIESITPFRGTLLKGQGTGHQAMLMPLTVEIGKDVVLAFVQEEHHQMVMDSIEERLRLREEGEGILVSFPVEEIY